MSETRIWSKLCTCLVDREAIVGEVAALLIEGVACLVDGACEALREITLLEARCHAHIRRVRPCSTPRTPTEALRLGVHLTLGS